MTAPQHRQDRSAPTRATNLNRLSNPTAGARARPSGLAAARPSRIGGVWVAFVVAAVVLLFLLIFILQNGQRAEVSFLGANGSLPVGVALLLAAVFGVLVVALPATARIVQLRTMNRQRASDSGTGGGSTTTRRP